MSPNGIALSENKSLLLDKAQGNTAERTDSWGLEVIEAGIVIGQGDDELDCGKFEFVALPRIGENLLIRLSDDLMPLRVVEVFHHPSQGGEDSSPSVVLRAEKR